MNKQKSRFVFWILLACFLLVAIFPAVCQHIKPLIDKDRSILFLDSYNQGYLWTEDLMEGLLEILSFESPDYDLIIEHMDTKNHIPSGIFPALAELYAHKYAVLKRM